jgi:hypothetical protein
LLSKALLGRNVIGTVSASGFAFFCLVRFGAGSSSAGGLTTGAADISTGAGTDPVPAGCLAAAAIRAANSLESRFFFIWGLHCDCAMLWNHNTAITRHCNSALLRMHGITPFCRRDVAIV